MSTSDFPYMDLKEGSYYDVMGQKAKFHATVKKVFIYTNPVAEFTFLDGRVLTVMFNKQNGKLEYSEPVDFGIKFLPTTGEWYAQLRILL